MKGSQENTICTISTKKGEGAIAIIRISGEKSINICYNIFSSKRIKKENDFKANTIYFGKVMKNNKVIDEVLLTYFKAPKSYTGEDVIEISCHGSEYIQNAIMQLLIENLCKLAKMR